MRGLPLLLGVQDDPAAKLATLARYARVAAGHGHDPAGVPHAAAQLAHLGDPAVLRPRLAAWLATTREYVRLDGTAGPSRDPERYADQLLRIHPVGDPAEAAGRLAELAGALAGAGVRHLLFMVEAAGPGRDTEAQIRALAAARARRR